MLPMPFEAPRLGLALAALALCACRDKPLDPDGPGDLIGLFDVAAKIETNTCGDGALGALDSWNFEVRLSREIGIVYWDNGTEIISGTLGSDKHTFSFDTLVLVNMRDASSPAGLPPCSIARHDRASGQIADDDTTFVGTLGYDFAPSAGSSCDDLVSGAAPTFAALPCAMSYALTAVRTQSP